MPKFRITISRMYEADIEAKDFEDAEEVAQQLVDSHHELLVVDSDLAIRELATTTQAREVA